MERNVIKLSRKMWYSYEHAVKCIFGALNVLLRDMKGIIYSRSCVWIWAMICLTSLNNTRERNVVKYWYYVDYALSYTYRQKMQLRGELMVIFPSKLYSIYCKLKHNHVSSVQIERNLLWDRFLNLFEINRIIILRIQKS